MSSEISRFAEKPLLDDSIRYEYHEYEPHARINLNSTGEVVISIELQHLFTHPCESYLVFEGRLKLCTQYPCPEAASTARGYGHP